MDKYLAALDRSPVSEKVYNAILAELINNNIAPGERLREESIAALLNVSRTPVREALQRLSCDGLVEFRPHRGAFARKISSDDIVELYDIRRCLEVHAAVEAIARIPASHARVVDDLIVSCRAADGTEFIERELAFDREIHATIGAWCGNSRLCGLLENMHNLARFMRIVHFDRAELARENFTEHEAIWDAMKCGDRDRMTTLLERHLDNRRDRLLEHFNRLHADKEDLPA